MSAPLFYITGTNTSVGKTTLACLLLRRARERDLRVAAMKPFCSGGRDDAEQLHALQTADLTLDEVNPFHFAEPVTPYIAARNVKRAISADQTIDSIRKIAARGDPMLIEGAGGLMSPLGDRFTLLDIIRELPGKICVVAPNVLGVINSGLLTHHALKNFDGARIRFVLMNALQADSSSATNAAVIGEWTGARTITLPFLTGANISQTLASLIDDLLSWWVPKSL